jgi:hypothetical protein
MLEFLLFALAIPFSALYVLAVLDITQVQARRNGQNLNLSPRVPATPRRLKRFAILSQRSSTSQLAEQMEFAESNVPASVAEFQAVILAGYGNA